MQQQKQREYTFAILRIVAGVLLTMHGLQKLFGWFGGVGGHGATVHTGSELWIAGLLETIGGPLVAVGLFTRVVAFVLCGEMAVAYFQVHFPRAFWPIQNAGETTVLYCFVFLCLCAAGAGPASLDRILRRK